MATSGLYILRSKRLVVNDQFAAERSAVLVAAAERLQAKARELAAKPTSAIATGTKTGRLQRAIKIKPPYASGSGKSLVTMVYVDTEVAPHALAQEEGTKDAGDTPWITPRNAKVMKWLQKGQAYRGPFVTAVLIGKRRSKKNPTPSYMQFATRVRGVHAKHYMRDSRSDPEIRKQYAADCRRLAKTIAQFK